MRHRVDASGLGLRNSTSSAVPTPFAQTPVRQRKGWSFLTWAFFLPHLAASEVFFGTGARAEAQADAHNEKTGDASTSIGSSMGDTPHAGASPDPGEAETAPLGGSASYNGQLISAAIATDVQQASAASGLKGPVGDSSPASSGGGGGGSEIGDFSLDGRNADSLDARNTDENVISNASFDHPTDPMIAMSSPQENPRVGDVTAQVPPELVVSRPAAEDGDHSSGGSEPTQAPDLPYEPLGLQEPSYVVGYSASVVSLTDALSVPGVAVETKALLGFEINLNADGLTADLNGVPFSDLLGFDARLSADGIFAGVNVGLSAAVLTAESLAASVTSTVDSALHSASAELGNILALDGHLGKVLLPDLLESDSDSTTHSLKATLAEVTGVQVLGSTGDGPAGQLVADVTSATYGAVAEIAEVASGAGSILTRTHIVSDASDVSVLSHTGDVSAGGVISFPGQVLENIDTLFAGPRYTDYNVALQSQKGTVGEHSSAVSSIVSGATDMATSIMDLPSSNHPEATSAINEQSHDNLLHTSLSVLHLASH